MNVGRWILFLLLILIAGGVYFWMRERRYLKKKTSQTMSDAVWREIVQEREAELKKRRQFREALDKAKKQSEDSSGDVPP